MIQLEVAKAEIHVEDLLAKLSLCWTLCNRTRVHSILPKHAQSQLYAKHSSLFLATNSTPIQNTNSCKRRRKKKWKKYACFACALKEPCSIITRLPKIKVSLLFWDKVVINPKLSWSTQKFLSTSGKWNDASSFHIYGGPHHECKRRKQHSQYFESI